MKIINFSKTFKNGVFRDFEILDFFATNPPLFRSFRKQGGGLLREMSLMLL